MVDLGKRLKELRKKRKLTQQQVAERIWVSKAMVSAYELSIRTPSYEVLIKLAKLFGVTTDYLLGLENIDDIPRKTIDLSNLTDEEQRIIIDLVENMKNHKN